jgi:DNA-binding winged helix-turn-helix (wHTH) protein
VVRYRFNEFMLCPQRRILVREGREVPLIPRYFDLLLLLIERRREAVHRREIFERVWADAIVSESALSQAVRTIRRALGDDSREPLYIRTVSRHGYRFVFPEVIEEEDDAAAPAVAASSAAALAPDATVGPAGAPKAFEPPFGRGSATPLRADVTGVVAGEVGEDELSDAAASIDGPLPLPLRLRRAARYAAKRWPRASVGGALAGIEAGAVGGLILAAAPGSFAPIAIAPVLAVIGGGCGALGGAGVGAGLAFAEAIARPRRNHASPWQRALALIIFGALGGGLVGASVQWLTRWALASLVGLDLPVGGGLDGVIIGSGAGLGFAIATRSPETEDGLAAPRGGKRALAACVIAICCGLAGLSIMLSGRPLAGGTIHIIADAADGSRATLAPLGRLIGEPDFGPISSAILAFGEAAVFGVGLAYALIRRRPR